MPPVRLYVGGLPPEVQQHELSLRFAPFGQVQSVELAQPKELPLPGGATLRLPRGFAHVEIEPKEDSSVQRCLSAVSAARIAASPRRLPEAPPSPRSPAWRVP